MWTKCIKNKKYILPTPSQKRITKEKFKMKVVDANKKYKKIGKNTKSPHKQT